MALVAYRNSHPAARIAGYSFKAFEVQPWLSGNPFENYHHGAKLPAYLVWSKREPWPAKTNLVLWQHLLATTPDLVVASRADFAGNSEPLEPMACRMGYKLLETFPGAVPWHGVVVEDEPCTCSSEEHFVVAAHLPTFPATFLAFPTHRSLTNVQYS